MSSSTLISRLNSALSEERARLLEMELRTDFAILKRQRSGEGAPPSRLYWALRSLPDAVRVAYLKCLLGSTSDESAGAEKMVLDRARLFDPLELKAWAERPSIELSAEQDLTNRRTRDFAKETNYYRALVKRLCKKDMVKRAFRECYFETTGRKLVDTGGSVYVDKEPTQMGHVRVYVEWDFGGWDHFRGDGRIEWEGGGKLLGTFCRWLGYGEMGWYWIHEDDLEQAARVAVDQTIEFQQMMAQCVMKALA